LELLAIKTICDGENRSLLLARLTSEYFGTDTAKEVFTRVTTLIQNGKSMPSTQVLAYDEALSEPSRLWIANPGVQATQRVEDVEAILDQLARFRKARVVLGVIDRSLGTMRQEDPDVDQVIQDMSAALNHCHSGEVKNEMLHLNQANAEQLLRDQDEELNRQDTDAIPMGFREFDKRTGGVRRKNVLVIASTPGGGKSAMGLQMALNQAMMGYKVCIVSFEMDMQENLYRAWSNISKISHSDLNLKHLSAAQRKITRQAYKDFLDSLGSTLTIWTPARELTMADIGVELYPYNYDIVYVDYVGLLKEVPGKAMWESLGIHARQSKIVANRLNAAMVLLAQYDDEGNKIKYSKAITANAHFVWAWDNSEQERTAGIIKVKQLKARNAEVYDFYLARDMSRMSFRDYAGAPPMLDSTPAPAGPQMPGMKG
jgi:replicative DNA helicase